jgi:hypothetical protein
MNIDLSKLSTEELLKLASLKEDKFAEEVSKQTRPVSNGESEAQVLNSAPILIPKINNYSNDFDLSKLIIKEIPYSEAKQYISKNHYSGCLGSSIRTSIGFFNNNLLVTAVIYGYPVGRRASNYLSPNKIENAELVRLFSQDGLPKNTESYCISKSFKFLKENYSEIKYLISYADGAHGHVGYIYQATNWKYIGSSNPGNGTFILDGKNIHPRTLYAKHGTSDRNKIKTIYGERVIIKHTEAKYIYIMCLGNKKECREWYSKFKQLPYPKALNDTIVK